MAKKLVHNKYWTLELCKEEAIRYSTRLEWKKLHNNSYTAAQKHGWLTLCSEHMIRTSSPKNHWTLERCKAEALKYSSRTEWYRGSMSSYGAAKISKWLDECSRHMKRRAAPNKLWTLELCRKKALAFSSRTEWRDRCSSFNAAYENKWLEECCRHMKASSASSSPERNIMSIIREKFPKAQTIRMKTKGFFINKPHIQGFDIDIYIPELRKGIEFNGDYWHSDIGLRRSRGHWPQEDIDNYHSLKKSFFTSKNIDYIEIWEKDWILDRKSCIDKCILFLKNQQNQIVNE